VLSENEQAQVRLDEVTYPILATGTSLCSQDLGYRLGLRLATVHEYPRDLQPDAARAFGLNDSLMILSLPSSSSAARAGLQPGDRVIAIGAKAIQQGAGAFKHFAKLLAESASAANPISVMVQRGSARRRFTVRPEEVCNYGAIVVNDAGMNAYADGSAIYVTSAMMRFVTDDELRVVVSHEFAHNAMAHIKAKKKNSLFGALIGALGDIAMASRGVNTGGYYTNQGAKLGAMTFSQDFEREADYVGIYALGLAGLPTSTAPNFWRRMAIADPKAIVFAHSHPTTAERFVRLEQTISEVNRKVASKKPLRPDPAGTPKPLEQPELGSAEINYARADTAVVSARPAELESPSDQSLSAQDDLTPAVQGYREHAPPYESPLTDVGVDLQPPSQPVVAATDAASIYSAVVDPNTAPPTVHGAWLGQPHGRVYYWATCQAAQELPEPIYFKSEEDAQRVGYRRSYVEGC
jgi:hypothetical protein